jgi:hypothetical protein
MHRSHHLESPKVKKHVKRDPTKGPIGRKSTQKGVKNPFRLKNGAHKQASFEEVYEIEVRKAGIIQAKSAGAIPMHLVACLVKPSLAIARGIRTGTVPHCVKCETGFARFREASRRDPSGDLSSPSSMPNTHGILVPYEARDETNPSRSMPLPSG